MRYFCVRVYVYHTVCDCRKKKNIVQILGISAEKPWVNCWKKNLILPEPIFHCRK